MMITHKLSEVRHADRIIVIGKQGLIAEGTHEALLQTCELYARLCNSASSPKVDNNKSSSTKKMAAHLGPFGKSKQTPQPEVTESSQQAILLEERQEPETLNTPDLESALTI
jgi:ABC-type multidrug transport system ATPase subunit